MSLYGLDDEKVKEAHGSAVAEPGGWFLLKYSSRDAVELMSRGTNGIVEIRNAIASYDEESPLYGFLKYRRRNVVIKYMPEDLSRLVQARAVVHFNAVCERFTPYNTTFEISAAKELKDTKLSAACSLHTASGSTSSSTSSLRRRRLMEIAEEEEEEERERKRQSIVQEEKSETPSEPPVVLDSTHLASPPSTAFSSTTEPPEFNGVGPSSPTKSEFGRRMSSQSARPEIYTSSSYTYGRPKVKLGPRPSLDASKRPQTADQYRPVSSMPAGLKLFSKGSRRGRDKDKSTDTVMEQNETEANEANETNANPLTIPIPEIPQDDLMLRPRPATSSGASIKSVVSSIAPSIKETTTKITPEKAREKARLMKAMKLREKKKQQSAMPADAAPAAEPAAAEAEPVAEEQESEDTAQANDDDGRSVSNPDSAIAIEPATPMTTNTEAPSEDTFTDSHPPSPTLASSEVGDSTKASSLSESTDETVQASKEHVEDADDAKAADEVAQAPEEHSETFDNVEATEDSTPVEAPISVEKVEDQSLPEDATAATSEADDKDEKEDEKAEEEEVAIQDSKDVPVTTSKPAVEESSETPEVKTVAPDATEDKVEPEAITPTDEIRTQEIVLPERKIDAPPKSPWGIPVSKFAADPHSPTSPHSPKFLSESTRSLTEPLPVLRTIVTPPRNSTMAEAAKDSSETATPELTLVLPKTPKRKGATVEPIRTDLTDPKDTPKSEATDPLLDDDDLMNELQSAEVQEAKPMTVSKSPINPVFPGSSPLKALRGNAQLSRTTSNPMIGPVLAPPDVSQISARSVSAGGAAYLHNITRQSSNAGLQAKKGNLGSSISQRIKALEQLSGKVGQEESRPRTATPSSTFFSVRKQNTEGSRSPSVAERADSLTRKTPTPERVGREAGSPDMNVERKRSGSVASRLSMFEFGGQPRGRPESIQVTARIIRDFDQLTSQRADSNKDATDYATGGLKQSPLVVDIVPNASASPEISTEPLTAPAEPPRETILERRSSRDKTSEDGDVKKPRRSSLTIMKDFIKDPRTSLAGRSPSADAGLSPAPSSGRPPSTHQNTNSLVRRLSISSRRSSFTKDRDAPASASAVSVVSPPATSDSQETDDDKADKKSISRASRFMRRLSNSLGTGRSKSSAPHISPTVAEEDMNDLNAAASVFSGVDARRPSQPLIDSYLGDVNVQFPDSLLWKRRSMAIDSQGYLILSAVQGVQSNGKDITAGTGLKRYHLSDFRPPYIPDVEIQELPNSVVLDFVDDSGIQVACEDRAGQLGLLHALQDAHAGVSSRR